MGRPGGQKEPEGEGEGCHSGHGCFQLWDEEPRTPPQPKAGLTLRPLGGGPAMQPHHHGGEGHLALHTVLPDGVDDSSWEVDVEVTEEDDAVRVLRTDGGGSADPTDQGSGVRPLPRTILRLLPTRVMDKLPQNKLLGRFPQYWPPSTILRVRE